MKTHVQDSESAASLQSFFQAHLSRGRSLTSAKCAYYTGSRANLRPRLWGLPPAAAGRAAAANSAAGALFVSGGFGAGNELAIARGSGGPIGREVALRQKALGEQPNNGPPVPALQSPQPEALQGLRPLNTTKGGLFASRKVLSCLLTGGLACFEMNSVCWCVKLRRCCSAQCRGNADEISELSQ